jgi:hypothetical protein
MEATLANRSAAYCPRGPGLWRAAAGQSQGWAMAQDDERPGCAEAVVRRRLGERGKSEPSLPFLIGLGRKNALPRAREGKAQLPLDFDPARAQPLLPGRSRTAS